MISNLKHVKQALSTDHSALKLERHPLGWRRFFHYFPLA
jgi:hypothetical protein